MITKIIKTIIFTPMAILMFAMLPINAVLIWVLASGEQKQPSLLEVLEWGWNELIIGTFKSIWRA